MPPSRLYLVQKLSACVDTFFAPAWWRDNGAVVWGAAWDVAAVACLAFFCALAASAGMGARGGEVLASTKGGKAVDDESSMTLAGLVCPRILFYCYNNFRL